MEEKLLTPKEYTRKYMDLYRKAQALFAQYNPCEPQADGTCIQTRKCKHYTEVPQDRCCTRCEFHDRSSGCKTIALSCKLWTCGRFYNMSEINTEILDFMRKLHALRNEADYLYPHPRTRESLDETLARLKDIWREEIEQWEQENSTHKERKSVSRAA